MKRKIGKRLYLWVYIWLLIFLIRGILPIFAYEMQSSNYQIWSSSINVGGSRQTSSNYKMEDTIGEIATGPSESANYKLKAGYQQMQETYLSVSSPSDVVMSPDIPGMTGGTATGGAVWTVITDNPAGYSLSVKASASPALSGTVQGDSFADYTPTNASSPDYNWSVADSAAEFGFNIQSLDVVQKFKDNGLDTCAVGGNNTADKCWYNFSTSEETIASSFSANHPSGVASAVNFKAQLYNADGTPNNNNGILKEDVYQATITATVTAN